MIIGPDDFIKSAMMLAVDVFYHPDCAVAFGVGFCHWEDAAPAGE
ncbi:MAG TPA: hypothetical protein PKH77_18565 [Anaerolineae bacterium]|nr:hypothetical protein [Anaerolineae bacterium]